MTAFIHYKEFSLKTQSAGLNMMLAVFNVYYCTVIYTHSSVLCNANDSASIIGEARGGGGPSQLKYHQW